MLQLPEATLILDGTRVADNLVAQGRSVLRKTGVGALELRNGVAQSDDGIEVTGGVLRLNTGLVEGTLAVSNATLESSSGEVDQLVIRSATVRLLRTPQAFTTLVVSNVSFDAASTLQLRFDNAGGGLPSGPAIDLEASGVADLGNATLDVQIDSVSNLGDKLVVLRNSGSNAVVGTFANLPEGSVLVAGGRLWRISYTGAPTGHDIVLTGEEQVITCDDIQHASNGFITVTGSAEPARTLILESTADFEEFTVLGSALPDVTGVWTFTDITAPALPHRFYRARHQ